MRSDWFGEEVVSISYGFLSFGRQSRFVVIFLYCPTCVEAVLLNGDDAVDCRVRGKAGPGGRSGGSGSRRDRLGRQTGESRLRNLNTRKGVNVVGRRGAVAAIQGIWDNSYRYCRRP